MSNTILKIISQNTELLSDEQNQLVVLLDNEAEELTKRKMKKLLEQQYQLGQLGKLNRAFLAQEGIFREKLKEKTAILHNNKYIFITVNPQESCTLELFQKKIDKLVKRKIFKGYCLAYEQRGTTLETQGKGMHCHILAERNLNYKPSKTKELVRNTLKAVVGNHKSPIFINLQDVGKEFAFDKIQYITGRNKQGTVEEKKEIKQIIDDSWRKNLGLARNYHSDEFITKEHHFKWQFGGKEPPFHYKLKSP